MNILEEKMDINNTLFRRYHSSNSQENSIELSALVNYNYDLVAYTIFKYFPKSLQSNSQHFPLFPKWWLATYSKE